MKDFSIQLTKLCLTVLLLYSAIALTSLSAQEPELIAEAEASQVYEGEPFNYKITLNHVDSPTPPNLDHFEDFSFQPVGETDLNSQQITIINGVRTEIIRRGRQYQFRLTPLKTGELTIPAPRVTIAGKTLEGKPIAIRVVAADEQDVVLLKLTVDRSRVYPTQPFTLSLQVAVKGLPSPANETDPLTVQPEPPRLVIDWMDDERLPKALQPDLPWQEVLQKLISRRGNGLSINSIRNSSAFSIFEDSSLAFHPKPKVVKLPDSAGNEVDYWTYEFSRTFSAKSAGTYDFSAANIKGNFATKVSRNRLQGEAIYAKSNSLSVEVRDVPQDGRPNSYIGAIGKFSLVSELSPTAARVGDPMTLTLSLNGTGALEDASPPDILQVPEIKANFRTYDGTSQTSGSVKRFTYSLRPLNANIAEFPAIPVSYFDVDKEEYVTLQTQPIALTLSAAQQLAAVDVVASGDKSTNSDDLGLQIANEGLFANYSLDLLRNDGIDPKNWLITWLALAGSTLFFNFAFSVYQRRNADPRLSRRRNALSRAQNLLAQAESLSNTSATEVVENVRRAIIGLISDLLDLPSQGMTVGEVRQHLMRHSVDDPLLQNVLGLLEQCDAAKFGATDVRPTGLIQQAYPLLQQLHHQLSSTSKFRSKVGLLALLTIPINAGCGTNIDQQTTRLFVEAQQSFDAAKSPDDFQQSALRYQQIVDSGVRSGALFFNQGNAWSKANQPSRAIAAYRQALRYLPRDSYVKANLQATRSTIEGLKTESQSHNWLSYIYFWKNWFSLRELFLLETVLVTAVLISSSICWISGRLKGFVAILAVPTLVVGAGCWLQWQDQLTNRHGVVLQGPINALKGDGDQYPPAFTGELPTGAEFRVSEQSRDWVEIVIEGVGKGWVKRSQVLLY